MRAGMAGDPCAQGSYVWIIRFTDADRIYTERWQKFIPGNGYYKRKVQLIIGNAAYLLIIIKRKITIGIIRIICASFGSNIHQYFQKQAG